MPKIVLSDESKVDSDNERVMVSGMRIERFIKNPILLYEHNRWLMPVGSLKGVKKEGGQLIADDVFFDEADELSRIIKEKFEKGSLSAFSIGFKPLVRSDLPEDKLSGQKGDTYLESELYEVSIVALPALEDAVVEREVEKRKASGEAEAGLIRKSFEFERNKTNNISTSKNKMNGLKKHLGLPNDSSETEVIEEVKALEKTLEDSKREVLQLKGELQALRQAEQQKSIDTLLADALAQKKITKKQEGIFRNILESDFENGKELLDSMEGFMPISERIKQATPTQKEGREGWSYQDWMKNDSKGLKEMKELDPHLFEELYRGSFKKDN